MAEVITLTLHCYACDGSGVLSFGNDEESGRAEERPCTHCNGQGVIYAEVEEA